MGTGYTRADVSNNIADGNIINSSDLDNEYDAIEAAFNSSTGHTHDGTSAEGAPITVLGPSQDFVASATEIKPKTTNTLDIGTSGLQFKDLYLDGTAYIDGLGEDILVATDKKVQFRDTALFINSSADGQLDIDADVEVEITAPTLDIDASTAVTIDTATLTITGSANVTGDLDVDNININGNTISSTDTNGNITLAPNGTGVVALSSTDLTFGDNDKAVFGAGSDLQIYHDGSNSIVYEGGTGTLKLATAGGSVDIVKGSDSSETMAKFNINGAAELYYDNAPKLATTATGVDITGTLTADGDFVLTGSGSPKFESVDTTNNVTTRLFSGNTVGGVGTYSNHPLSLISNSTTKVKIEANGDTGFLGGDISFYDSTGVTQGFYWDASTQRLGLGVTSPDARLEVQVESGGGDAVSLSRATATDTFRIRGDNAGILEWRAGGSYGGGAIRMVGGLNTGADKGTISFHTGISSGELQPERLRIDSSGNVGIGTSSPALDINANTRALSIYQNSSDGAGLGLLSSNCTMNIVSGNNASYISNQTSDPMIFRTNASEAMRIDSSGNVGIGTASPSDKLHVEGDIRVNNAIESANNLNLEAENGVLRFYTGSGSPSERMRIDSNGQLMINQTSSPVSGPYYLSVYSADSVNVALENSGTASHTQVRFINGNGIVGTIVTNASATSYNTSSDYRLKENVTADWDATTRLKQLNPVRFNFIADADTTVDGFLAHEVQDIVPEAITGTKDAVDADDNPVYQGIDQSKLVPLLVKTIQELEARIAALEAN